MIAGPAAWTGREMAATPGRWLRRLTAAEIAELKRAGGRYVARGGDLAAMTAADFALGGLGDTLAGVRETLLRGCGVAVLRGLPVDDRALAAAVFCGIGAHLGHARPQNARGDVLGHVRDTGVGSDDPAVRIYQTAERQTFHTDSADVVGLLCLQAARRGGRSLLVSGMAIYNWMLGERPDLVARLFEPMATDRRGEVPAGAKPYVEIPVFNWHAGFLTVFYQRQYIDSAQRYDGVLRLTDEHVAALDMFDELANNPDMHFGMDLEPGDMQFVYNHALLHDRTGFVDWLEAERRRHLLRLWLAMPGDRPLPDCFAERYGSVAVGDRGGIVVTDAAPA